MIVLQGFSITCVFLARNCVLQISRAKGLTQTVLFFLEIWYGNRLSTRSCPPHHCRTPFQPSLPELGRGHMTWDLWSSTFKGKPRSWLFVIVESCLLCHMGEQKRTSMVAICLYQRMFPKGKIMENYSHSSVRKQIRMARPCPWIRWVPRCSLHIASHCLRWCCRHMTWNLWTCSVCIYIYIYLHYLVFLWFMHRVPHQRKQSYPYVLRMFQFWPTNNHRFHLRFCWGVNGASLGSRMCWDLGSPWVYCDLTGMKSNTYLCDLNSSILQRPVPNLSILVWADDLRPRSYDKYRD